MKKELYLLSVLLLSMTSNVFAMNGDTVSETNTGFVARLECNIKNCDGSPPALLKATQQLNAILNNAGIEADQKTIWYNWIVKKTSTIIQVNKHALPNSKFDVGALMISIRWLKPEIRHLPNRTVPIIDLEDNA